MHSWSTGQEFNPTFLLHLLPLPLSLPPLPPPSPSLPPSAGQDVDLSEILDPHTVTGLLKVHFREQRVSLIPRGQPLADISLAVKARDVSEGRGGEGRGGEGRGG